MVTAGYAQFPKQRLTTRATVGMNDRQILLDGCVKEQPVVSSALGKISKTFPDAFPRGQMGDGLTLKKDLSTSGSVKPEENAREFRSA